MHVDGRLTKIQFQLRYLVCSYLGVSKMENHLAIAHYNQPPVPRGHGQMLATTLMIQKRMKANIPETGHKGVSAAL